MSQKQRFTIVEEYVISGVKRYKIKDDKTGLIVNVAADSSEEAMKKALEIIKKVVSME